MTRRAARVVVRLLLPLLLSAIAVQLASHSAIGAAAAYTQFVHIGLLLTLDPTGCNVNPNCYAYITGQPAGLAFAAAIDQINARSDLLPNTGIISHINDTKCNGVQMDTLTMAVYQRDTYNVVGFIGEGESDYALPAAWLSTVQSVPQISFAATSPIYDNNAKFPNFYRTIGSIAKQCIVLANAVKAMGWRRYAYVSSVNALALASAQEFKRQGERIGLELVSGQVVSAGQTDISYQLGLIKAARAHIIALFCDAPEASEIIKVAIQQGIWGAKYQWVSHWDLMVPEVWTSETGQFEAASYNFSQNMIGILPHIEYSSATYKAFSKFYSTYPYTPQYASQYQKLPNTRAALAFDATYAMAYAIDASVEKRGVYPPSAQSISEQLSSVNFNGATGQVLFDAGGSRIMPYDVVQMQDGNFVPMAVAYPPNFDIVFISSDPVNRGFRFGNNIKPLDDDDRIELTVGSSLLFACAILFIVGFALCLFLQVQLYVQSARAMVKPLAPKFLRVILAGCLLGLGGLVFSPMDPGNTSVATWRKSCLGNLWCLDLAYVMIVGALIAKSRKIAHAHAKQGLHTTRLTDKNLMRMVGLMLAGDIIILLVWTLLDPVSAQFVVDATPVTFRPICTSKSFTLYNSVSMAYKALLLVWALYTNAYSRVAPATDAKAVNLNIINMTFLGVVIFPLAMSTTDVSMFNLVKVFGICLGVFGTIFINFGSFMWAVLLDNALLDEPPPTNLEKKSSAMPNSVQDVLTVRARSRFFLRKCYFSEKKAKAITWVVLAGALITYSYLNVKRMVDDYRAPNEYTKDVTLPSFEVPGILLCQSANVSYAEFLQPSELTLYGDPRLGVNQYVDLGEVDAQGNNVMWDCCLTKAVNFFVDCYTNRLKCPTQVRYRPQIRGRYGVWNVTFDCIDIAPGITVPSSDWQIIIPYYLVTDRGFLSTNADGSYSNASDPRFDAAYLNFCNNYQYWPHKLVLFSYIPKENATNPIDVYYGALDDNVGGPRGRWRIDLSRNIASISVDQFQYRTIDGTIVPSKSGFLVAFDMDVQPIAWITRKSSFNPTRLKTFELTFCHIRVSLSMATTQPKVTFDYKELITTFLAIISAAGTIMNFFVGPGDYDPTGCLNKLFYFDVPTLKQTASSKIIKTDEGEPKKKKASDGGDEDFLDDEFDDDFDEDFESGSRGSGSHSMNSLSFDPAAAATFSPNRSNSISLRAGSNSAPVASASGISLITPGGPHARSSSVELTAAV